MKRGKEKSPAGGINTYSRSKEEQYVSSVIRIYRVTYSRFHTGVRLVTSHSFIDIQTDFAPPS
nr:unnamed protein product [Callosobruchus chinensis]